MDPFAGATRAFRSGQPAVFVNELRDVGVVGIPIAQATVEHINFFVRECRGILYAAVSPQRLMALGVPPQEHTSGAPGHLHVPVDVRTGVTTGVSAADRVRTVRALIDPQVRPDDFHKPGHVIPMAMEPGGVLERLGLAEAVNDACTAAGFPPGVTFCGVLLADGRMADAAQLRSFAARHGLPFVRLADVVRARRRTVGWAVPGRATIALPYLGVSAAVRVNGGGRVRDRLPVTVIPACVAGHVLGACGCTGSARQIVELLDGGHPGAVVATWPDSSVPSCERPVSAPTAAGLADVVAADQCAATAAPPAGAAA